MPPGELHAAATQAEEAATQTSQALRALRPAATPAQYHAEYISSPVLEDATVVAEDYGYLDHLLKSAR